MTYNPFEQALMDLQVASRTTVDEIERFCRQNANAYPVTSEEVRLREQGRRLQNAMYALTDVITSAQARLLEHHK